MAISITLSFGLVFIIYFVFAVARSVLRDNARLRMEARLRAIEHAKNVKLEKKQLKAFEKAYLKQERALVLEGRIAKVRAVPTAVLARIGIGRSKNESE